ncbi:MAG: signal recognition particle-docking protein FtsY [Bacteroidetes bacterium]|nr:signal recognition particle-docking protein FtsY [Bacteroidota bacterium]MBU1116373.1 signal recognition particle-docking protein FtsY [Bacteroidota bacterium]MBU1800397.1 signal recognition particle-docking protein FtsY [Bacteroidota bacterium]
MFKNFNLDKLKNGLSKTKKRLFDGITEAISTKAVIDEDVLDELEEILITSDIGVDTAMKVIKNTRAELYYESDRSKINIKQIIKNELESILQKNTGNENDNQDLASKKPYVILVVGVNGAGKTTTIGKLAYNYKNAGLNVLIASADTFRAAANEQLEIWANRAGVKIIQKSSGADPSSVVFEALEHAKLNNVDIVLIDTAGRLHTKSNLMKELEKIRNVVTKVVPHAPNEVLLVVDGNSGQNALVQANEFSKSTQLTGLIVTKLDGTAKGGVIIQISAEQKIPIKYIGVGEGIDDLQDFDSKEFIEALFS